MAEQPSEQEHPSRTEARERPGRTEARERYWRTNLRYLAALLSVWFFVSYGCGVLFVEALDRIRIGGFKLGFWFAQQGSMLVFVALIFVYVVLMNRLDRRYGLEDRGEQDGGGR